MRLVVPLFLLFLAVKAVEFVAGRLQVQIDYTWFWVGLGVAVVVAFSYFWLVDWWGTVTRPSRPQTITLKTTETPSQITSASLLAIIELVVIIFVIGFIISQILLLL